MNRDLVNLLLSTSPVFLNLDFKAYAYHRGLSTSISPTEPKVFAESPTAHGEPVEKDGRLWE